MDNSLIKSNINAEIAKLQLKLTKIEQEERRSTPSILSERQIENKREYERRVSVGEDVAPLVEHIELEDLVGTEIYEAVLKNESSIESHNFLLRGCSINFYTPNLRSLWQSSGQEYIEPELLDFIDSVPGDGIYFDVGASTGVFAVYAAMKGKKTYCFEPEVANFNILNLNSFLNHAIIKDNFFAFNLALSNEKTINKMFIRKFGGAAHEKILGKGEARDGTESFIAEYTQNVITLTMDEFCSFSAIAPTDIKIDVDGAELPLLEGMTNILKNPALKRIFIEISETEVDSMQALDKLLSCGFRVHKKTRVQNYFTEYNYTLHRS